MRTSARPLLLALATLALCAVARADEGEELGDGPVEGPEILHIPELDRKAEQGILRPVPLAVELPNAVALRARRVLVHYRLWGDPDWTTLELRRDGATYEGAIPCLEISTVTGDLRYYIRIHDADGQVIAAAGSRAEPYIVQIRNDDQLTASAPGAPVPPRAAKCPDPADCPRGLPGCPSERVTQIACHSDSDCEGEQLCSWRGLCEADPRKKTWVSLGLEQDAGLFSRSGVCSLASQEHEGTACFRADGSSYAGTAVHSNEPLAFAGGPTRVVLGVERLVYYDTSVGLRLGWILRGEGPTPRGGTELVPFSAAVRLTHWFGEDPFARPGLRPFTFVTTGYGMTDLATTTVVREDPTANPFQQGNDLEQRVDLWKRAGDGFVGGGAGLSFPWGDQHAVFAELALLGVFPFSAVVLAPSAGVSWGF
jgi:hypothetical protein